MQELINWLNENVGDNIQFVSTPHERQGKREIEYVPETEEYFYNLVSKAPTHILKSLGFGKWETMNNLIEENQGKPESNPISIPILNSSDAPDQEGDAMSIKDGNLIIDCGIGNAPTEKLIEDADVWLFPAEWYNKIPNGFIVTGLYGEAYPFQKGKSDDDIRFGCLAYGIRRKINP